MRTRTDELKPTQCAYCDTPIDVYRYRDLNFCGDAHRSAYHKEQNRKEKAEKALKILGDITGLAHIIDSEGKPAHLRLRMLGDTAILKAVNDKGYKWSAKHRSFKDKNGVLYGYEKGLFSGDEPEQKPEPDTIQKVMQEYGLTEGDLKILKDAYEIKPMNGHPHLIMKGLMQWDTDLTSEGRNVIHRLQVIYNRKGKRSE